MSSSIKSRSRSCAIEKQPRNCFICSECVPNPKSTKSGGAKLICQRFCTLASRYLTFRTKYLNPEVTISQNLGEFVDDIVELCDACVYELRAFFETYNGLSLLQLRLNRKLKEIGELMKMRMPFHQGPRPGRKSEKKSKSEEFKRTFLEQVDKIDKDFPQLRLERVEVDTTGSEMEAPPRKKSECGVASTIVVVKQEQMEIVDDCEGVEPERGTLPYSAEDDHDDDHDYNYPDPGAAEDDNDDDILPSNTIKSKSSNYDDQCDNWNDDSPQNATGSGGGIENPVGLGDDLARGDRRRRKDDTSLQCVYCGRQFSKRYSRVLHERLHTGERPYKCSMCDREFSHLSTWKSHSDAKHKGKAEVIKPPPKIKVRNKNNWRREIAKQRRLKGEVYQGYTRKELDPETGKMVFKSDALRKGRKMGPPCKSKKCRASERRSCNEFSDSQRKELFDHFWKKLDNWDAKKHWVRELVQTVPVQRQRGILNSVESRRNRSATFRYHLPLNGEMEQVCCQMFLNTLALNSTMVQNWIRKRGGSDNDKLQNTEVVVATDNNQDQNEDAGGKNGYVEVTPETLAEEMDGVIQTQTTLCKEHE